MSSRQLRQPAFLLEREMVGPVREWLCSQGLLVAQELQMPWGRCDLVGVTFDEERVRKRLSLGQRLPIGSMLRVGLLAAMPDEESRRGITQRALARKFAAVLDGPEVEIEIEKLISLGQVLRTPTGSYKRLNGWSPLHERIVAVELKLERISEVLSQARSNLAFATESYVGLPAVAARRVTASETRVSYFEETGVGLLAVDATSCCVLIPPVSRSGPETDEVVQMYCAERFWDVCVTNTAT